MTVATHEVGHALQDRDNYAPLRARTNMVRWVGGIQKIGSTILFGSLLLRAATQAPGLTLLVADAGIATIASGVLVHLITLSVEFDASFGMALPILNRGGYLPPEDMSGVRSASLSSSACWHSSKRLRNRVQTRSMRRMHSSDVRPSSSVYSTGAARHSQAASRTVWADTGAARKTGTPNTRNRHHSTKFDSRFLPFRHTTEEVGFCSGYPAILIGV